MGKFTFNDYFNFCENYKKVAMEYGKRKAEIIALEKERIQAQRERGWGIISKEDTNYYINTFPVEYTKKVYDFLKDSNNKEGSIRYYIMSSITLRALEKLCFKAKSSFIQELIQNNEISEEYLIRGKYNTFLKRKEEFTDQEFINFYSEILENQTTLGIMYRHTNSLKKIKSSKSLEELEINIKLETYVMKEYQISEERFSEILNKYKGNKFQIINSHRGKFVDWRGCFWGENNKNDNYILRLNPEIVVSLRKGNENYKDKKHHRKAEDSYLLTMSLSHFSDKSYINDAFIEDDDRKTNLTNFNKLYNDNESKKFDYIYGLDKGTNELTTLGVYKIKNNQLGKINISQKIPIYKITQKGLKYTKTTLKKNPQPNEEKETIHTLYKNPSLFMDEITQPEIFEKIDISSCIGNLNTAKLIKGNIILNGDINTFINLYKTAAKRLLFIAISEGSCISEEIGFNTEERYFYYEYENRGEKQEKKIYYILENTNLVETKEEVEKEFNEYIKKIKDGSTEEDVSIQKINNLKNALSANIVGIISKLQEIFPGYITWESLDEYNNKKDMSQNPAFLGNLINDKIYQNLVIHKDVPPILKKYRMEMKKGCFQHGKVIYVSEKNTSSACPVCNDTLLQDKNGNLKDKDDKQIFKLGGHMSDFEHEMKHLTDEEYQEWLKNDSFKRANTEKGKEKTNKYYAGDIEVKSGENEQKTCDYYIGNEYYPEFEFIKSGDDLATYNIAKKAKEYLEFLSGKENAIKK